jgi:hypothetical protein
MRFLFTGVVVAGLLASGCKTQQTYYVDAGVPVGLACPVGDECYNGAICAEGECTVPCTGAGQCAAGYDCRPFENGFACLKVRYAADTVIGKSCAIDATVCGGGQCQNDGPDDPDAYCTGPCTDDRDCPASTYCGVLRATADTGTDNGCGVYVSQMCVKKGFCSPCVFDSDCPDGVCAVDSKGQKFCTKPCTPPTWTYDPNLFTCPQPYAECKDRGDGVTVCMHRYGSCVGDGAICSPCRSRADCQANALCGGNDYTKEKYCEQACSASNPCPTTQTFVCLSYDPSVGLAEGCLSQCENWGSTSFNPSDANTYPNSAMYPTCWPDWVK